MDFFSQISERLSQEGIVFVGSMEPREVDSELLGNVEYLSLLSPSRLAEFCTGRWCAQRALEALGCQAQPINRGVGGEPIWPEGFCGSISHTRGACCAVAASKERYLALGIDVERIDRKMSDAAVAYVSVEEEKKWLEGLGDSKGLFSLLLFSIKESIIKACYASDGEKLSFDEIIVPAKPQDGIFSAELCSTRLRVLAGLRIQGFFQPGATLLLSGVTIHSAG